MSQAQIKGLYNEAGTVVTQARAILDEHQGKAMPAEKQAEYDRLMDAYDQKTAQAKQLERVMEAESKLGEPQNRLGGSTALGQEQKGTDGEPSAELKALRKGLSGGRLNEAERKALRADDDEAGGFLTAPQHVAAGILKFVDDLVIIRQLAAKETVTNGASLGIITMDEDLTDPEWTTELETGNVDTVKPFGKRALTPHPLAKRAKISKTLIRNSTRPIEQIVQQRLGYRFAVAEEKAYMTGDGNKKPLGLFTASDAGIPTSRDVAWTATNDKAKADSLIDFVYALKRQYRRSATTRMITSREFVKAVRKLRDANEQFIWTPGLGTTQPETILETPVLDSEYAPSTISSGNYLAVLGDLQFYQIVDSLMFQIQVLTELYAESNQNGYIGRYEGDGMPILGEAFARLKHA